MARILVVQGHPDTRESHLCHKLAEAYSAGAEQGGHTIRRLEIGRMDISFLTSRRDWENSPPTPTIARAQESVLWAEHIVLFLPLWLGDMPALIKAFFEQLFRPGFAIEGQAGAGFRPLLGGRSARIVITMGMPAFVYRWYFGASSVKIIKRNVLNFVGIRPVGSTLIGSVDIMPQATKQSWLDRLRRMGLTAR